MPDQAEAQILADPISNAYAKVWQSILDQQKALVEDPLNLAKRRRLREMQASIHRSMVELNATAKDWIEHEFPKAYAIGGNTGIAEAGGAGAMTWDVIAEEAVERLATGLYDDLLKATTHVDDTAKALIRAIGKDVSLQKLIQGRTAVQAGREMRKLIEAKGIHAIRYANGAKHGLAEYSQMAMRTVTGNAYNLGTLQGAAGEGVTHWEVFDGVDCGWEEHNSPNKSNGRIVTMQEAMTYPLAHPNCRRAFGPRPDITKKPARQKEQDASLGQAQPLDEALASMQPKILSDKNFLSGDWQQMADFDKRGSAFFSQSYEAATTVPAVMRNIERGLDPFDGITDADLNTGWFKVYVERTVDFDTMESVYSVSDLKADILNSARVLSADMASATRLGAPLYRGMRVDSGADIFKPGYWFDADLSSATPRSDVASMYTQASKYRIGDTPVVVEMRGVRGVDIDQGRMTGGQAGSKEHLVSDSLTVIEAEWRDTPGGRVWWVVVNGG